jgi:hypothetical protein
VKAIKCVALKPALSQEEAGKQFKDKYLDHGDFDRLIEDDLQGVLMPMGSKSDTSTRLGETKFLFLRNIIPPQTALELYKALSRLRFGKRNHSRRSVGSGKGGDVSLGWFDKPVPRLLGATCRHRVLYSFHLVPLLNALSGVIRDYLPDYWRGQASVARRNKNMVIGSEYWDPNRIAFFHPNVLGKENAPPNPFTVYPPVFSTVTANKNVIFRCHVDPKNNSALACLMAFGDFAGGYLCLPRLNVAFNLRPGDLLLADNSEEMHGNIGPLVGERISLVAYLRECE